MDRRLISHALPCVENFIELGPTHLDLEGIDDIEFEENFTGKGEDLILTPKPGETIRLIVDDAVSLAERIEENR